MLFSELYSAYYNTVAAVLREAAEHPVSDAELREIIGRHAFGESALSIPEALKTERWQLLLPDGTPLLRNPPSLPLTLLQKRWLKALACDPRIRLFGEAQFDFPEAEPLFLPSDVIVFDRYADGDPYEDETYIANFRLILDAVKENCPLEIVIRGRNGDSLEKVILPEYLEYSEKDDKFRLIGTGSRMGNTVNLGRILSCRRCEEPFPEALRKLQRLRKQQLSRKQKPPRKLQVVFELEDQRKALERALLHFAHFEKTAERIGENRYRVTLNYEKEDETEIVIRILSFGPMVRVTAPEYFVRLIRQRLTAQQRLGL